MKFHFKYHLVENVRKSGDISVLDGFFYEQFNDYIKRSYRGSSRKQATRMQDTLMLMERQQRSERSKMSAEIGSSSRSADIRGHLDLQKKVV